MRGKALLAAIALICAPATAQEAPAEPGGVWKGTMGDQAITVCMVPPETGNSVYYRDRALEPVRLETREGASPFVLTEATGAEDATGAQWVMQPAHGETMTGEWRKGAETLPIRLAAVPVDVPEYGSVCEAAAFIEPLLAGGTYTQVARNLGAATYTELAYDGPARAGLGDYHVRSFAIEPAGPADATINATLAAALPDGTAAHMMGQCAAPMLANAGVPGYIDEALSPMLITPRWVALRSGGSSYCGGAHPNNDASLAVYDRQSGAEVDPATWFKPGALAFYDWEPEPGRIRPVKALSAALTEAIMARWPEGARDPECLDAARDGWGWDIGLAAEGPVFVPQFPHVIFACTEEVTLPWSAARPFLSPEGRAVMESLR